MHPLYGRICDGNLSIESISVRIDRGRFNSNKRAIVITLLKIVALRSRRLRNRWRSPRFGNGDRAVKFVEQTLASFIDIRIQKFIAV